MSQPFLLLTPLGRLDARVIRTLHQEGVRPRELQRLADYPSTATALYSRKPSTPERLRVRRAYEDAWRARVSDVSAEVWWLDQVTFERAWAIKPRLRLEWPPETVPFEQRALYLRTFHLPDPEDVAREWAWLTSQGLPPKTGSATCDGREPGSIVRLK